MNDAGREPFRPGGRRLRIVFLCYGNACRSQMAEAYARALGGDVVEASSAGVSPVGFIPPEVALVMEEEGISIEGQYSKSLNELGERPVDLIVDLAGLLRRGPGGVPVETRVVIDPFGGDLEDYRRTRGAVRETVQSLLEALRSEA